MSSRPGTRVAFWVGVVIGLVGLAVGGGLFVRMFVGLDRDVEALHRFGRDRSGGALEMSSTTTVTLFIEPGDRSLDGVRYALIDVVTGREVEVQAGGGSEYTVGGRSGRSLATVTLEPGSYLVEVAPADVTVAVGPSPVPGPGTIVFPVAVGGSLVVVGSVIAVWAALAQSRRRNEEAVAAPPPSSAWVTGSWEDAARPESSLEPPPGREGDR